jgi:hypothetical protein
MMKRHCRTRGGGFSVFTSATPESVVPAPPVPVAPPAPVLPDVPPPELLVVASPAEPVLVLALVVVAVDDPPSPVEPLVPPDVAGFTSSNWLMTEQAPRRRKAHTPKPRARMRADPDPKPPDIRLESGERPGQASAIFDGGGVYHIWR